MLDSHLDTIDIHYIDVNFYPIAHHITSNQ